MIIINKQPLSFSPVESPVIFQLQSDNDNILYFSVQVKDAETDSVLANQKYYTLPDLDKSTFFDLSSLLANFLTCQLIPSDNLIEETHKSFKSFKLDITEKIISGSTVVNGANTISETYNVWNGSIDKLRMPGYQVKDYVASINTVTTQFLTDKPDLGLLYPESKEYLNLLNDSGATAVEFKVYDKQKALSGTYTKPIDSSLKAIRIDISPESLSDEWNINFENVSYYSVRGVDALGFSRTQTRNYQIKQSDCRNKETKLIFLNQLGGWDSVNFFNMKESLLVTKTNINQYPYQIDSNGNYSNIDSGVYNAEQETINVNSTSTYTVNSDKLSDDESIWLKQLIQSKKVFVALESGDFLPIQINANNYEVLQKRLSTNNRLSLSFTADGDIVKAGDAIVGAIPATAIMITSFSEFDYNPDVVYATTSYGNNKALNATYESIKLGLGTGATKSDFAYMVQEDLARIPTIKDTVLWINWFSGGMRNPTDVKPYIQETIKLSIRNSGWTAGGITASGATMIPKSLKGGGSGDDNSFLKGAKYLQDLGYKIGIISVISTAEVTGKTYLDYLNWRGYIFFDDVNIFNSWNTEYQNFIKWYVDLCYDNNIDLNYIYVGSEFQCLLTANPEASPAYQEYKALNTGYTISKEFSQNIRNLFIKSLGELGAYAKAKFPDSVITYAANWSEYGYNDGNFNLDSLWINPNIDRIGIDYYFPMSEVHTNSNRQLKAGLSTGEYYDSLLVGYDNDKFKLSSTDGLGKSTLLRGDINPAQGLKNIVDFRDLAHYAKPRLGCIADASPLLFDEDNYYTTYDSKSLGGISGTTQIALASGITANEVGGSYPRIELYDSYLKLTGSTYAMAKLPSIPSGQTLDSVSLEVDFKINGKNTDFDRITTVSGLFDVIINQQDPDNPYVFYSVAGATAAPFYGYAGTASTVNNLKIDFNRVSGDTYSANSNLNGTNYHYFFTGTTNTIANFLTSQNFFIGVFNQFNFATMLGEMYRFKLAIKSNDVWYGGIYNFEDTYAGVRTEWDYFEQFDVPVTKIMATEIGAGSFNGSSTNPNIFVTAEYANEEPPLELFPEGHNLKGWFDNLKQFGYYLIDMNGTYGSTFELDELHQKKVIEAEMKYLNSIGIDEHVVYTLSSKYSRSFGATFFNDETERYELYSADSPIYPLSHAINGKLANGYTEGVLELVKPNIDLTQFTPLPYPEIPDTLAIGTPTANYNSYINPDISDFEWVYGIPTGNTIATVTSGSTTEVVINSGKTATGNCCRAVRFYTYGIDKAQRVPISLNFEAMGDGVIEAIIYSTYNSTQARQTFELSNTGYTVYNWQPARLYPDNEYILAFYVNGKNADSNVTATFKKSIQMDMTTPISFKGDYKRLRADATTIVGSGEPADDWYGYDDYFNTVAKKYYQSSAFSKMSFDTDANEAIIEFVRDFYNVPGKNVYNFLTAQNGKGLNAAGQIEVAPSSISGFIPVEPATDYVMSGFLTTNQYYCFYDTNKQPITARKYVTSPTFKTPVNAAYIIILGQSAVDSYTAYLNGMIEKGTVATSFARYTGAYYIDISGLAVYVNDVFREYITLEPGSTGKKIQQVKINLPYGNKKVTIQSNGRGAYSPFNPLLRRSGTFLRSVYLPDTGATINTSVKTGNIVFVGDSIISGFNLSTNPQKNLWVNAIKDYGFAGDVFHQSYAGLILNTHIGTASGATAFAAKFANYPNVDKIFIQGGINDGGNNIPLSAFTAFYPDFLDKLHAVNPTAKIYCLGFTPAWFETNNIGVTYDEYRDAIQAATVSRPYTEFIDFRNIYPKSFSYIPDGIHPNDLGNLTLLQGLIDKTDIV